MKHDADSGPGRKDWGTAVWRATAVVLLVMILGQLGAFDGLGWRVGQHWADALVYLGLREEVRPAAVQGTGLDDLFLEENLKALHDQARRELPASAPIPASGAEGR